MENLVMSEQSSGSLYVVATPIGNLADLSRRAEQVLQAVQIVAAEDTRRTSVLLAHVGHRAPELVSLHDHNEAEVAPRLVARLAAGTDVALVSDAGTPLLNDPGFLLVQAAYRAGIRVVPVPGASAVTAVLSVCPLPCQPFRYVGFLPAKAGAREQLLRDCVARPEATVFFDAPHRIVATLDLLAAMTDRPLLVARELTKKFEALLVGSAAEVRDRIEARGEFVCVLAADPDVAASRDHAQVLRLLLAELPAARAAKVAAALCGVAKKQMYELALELSD